MRKSSLPPQPRADDEPNMRRAISALNDASIRFSRSTEYQLKVGDLSFYPNKGTIFRDGDDGALDQLGLDAFLSLLPRLVRKASSPETIYLVDDSGDQDRPRTIDLSAK